MLARNTGPCRGAGAVAGPGDADGGGAGPGDLAAAGALAAALGLARPVDVPGDGLGTGRPPHPAMMVTAADAASAATAAGRRQVNADLMVDYRRSRAWRGRGLGTGWGSLWSSPPNATAWTAMMANAALSPCGG